MIRNCMNANTLEHLSPDDDNGKAERYYCDGPVVNRSRRPRGRPYKPCDLGSPSWFEEQRILYAVWRVVVFFVLKDATNNFDGLFSPPWSSVHYLYPKSTHIAGFWAEQTSSDEIQMEQLRSVLSWMEKEAGGKEKIQSWMFSASPSPSALPDSLGYCCPQYRAVNKRHWVWFNAHPVKMLYSRGYSCIRSCILGPTSPLEGGDVFYYRRFGLVFWDSARLNALGFPGRRVGAAKMWFAWSSVLTDDQWEAVIKLQRQRYDRERCSMRTIPR
ncbi:hypothetical protein Plec18167_007861 [Paecilomyces lecythidis]|uniref:Uncharacterized protein n=1 Tax=Paecilomyces lecythidis TaxID=3004212 RepID=A0ABR3X1K9_9EURO